MTAAPTPIVLVGAGGLGREAAACLRAANAACRRTWDLVGFVDDRLAGQVEEVDGIEVIGPVERLAEPVGPPERPAQVLVCTGRPGATESRRVLARLLAGWGRTFATVIHPTASLAAGTTVGPGSLLLAGVVVTAPQHIGHHVVMMPHVVVTHDDRIGDFTTFGAAATLAGDVRVGDGAYVGSAAVVREHVTIGSGALVGMGSVVLADVPAGEVWAGNPARPIRRADAIDLDAAVARVTTAVLR